MKLHQLVPIKESTDPRTLLSEIKQRCALNVQMYRGANDGPIVFHRQVRQDRRPLNATVLSTALFNYAIEEAFKVPAVRNRCTFASSDKQTAEIYGDAVYCLFPPKDAMVLFDEQVADSGDILDDIAYELMHEIGIPKSSLAAIEGLSTQDSKTFVQKFMEPMDKYKLPEFKEWLDFKLPTYIEGYQLVPASNIRLQSGNIEFMVISSDIYGVNVTYANENVGGEGTAYERVVQLIQEAP